MTKVKSPPKDPYAADSKAFIRDHQENLHRYLEFMTATDHMGRYLHFDSLRHRIPKDLVASSVWHMVKAQRNSVSTHVLDIGDPKQKCTYYLTPIAQKAISETDRNTTKAVHEYRASKLGEKPYFDFLLKDLIEDEAISSSQLEGAVTTTKAAKKLIKREAKPKTDDEKMIIGNLRMMRAAWSNRKSPMTLELFLEIHRIGTDGIDDEKYKPGTARISDDVDVRDYDDNIVYEPPTYIGIEDRLNTLFEWMNENHHSSERQDYLHPLVKAIMIHFFIGFEHPFYDGNGRVARALFYWYIFKNDFTAFRYISISHLLKQSATDYAKSYLYTETDDLDLTYFIDCQAKTILRAINRFNETYEEEMEKIRKLDEWIYSSGFLSKINNNEKILFVVAKNNSEYEFTVKSAQKTLGCSKNTASAALNKLVKLEVFEKSKEGRNFVFGLKPTEQLIGKLI